ncbi:MAG: T9SS type A sorting domain-containing protein [Bacteroidetes bacterium]|nr:T9SS type A sorting domain-containing protein [Bacteroidota bacterium]MBL7104398.1 T9SS type A sorting domain-containing protein [Bacteroidales bacterium]
MKKLLLQLAIVFCASSLFAQWVPVNNGLDDYPPTSLWPFADTMVLSTYGGGVYKTYDNGENWNDINGNLGNLFVNDIRGYASYTSMFVATEGGPYITLDQVDYTDCTSTGLTNTDVNYFWWGDENMGGDFMVGTNGGGVFASEEYTGPWTAANTGLSGDGFIVNDLGGYSDDDLEFTVMATDGGTYWAIDGAADWTEVNTGLSGDALKVKRLTGLGSLVLIATHGGLYYDYDLSGNWGPLIPDEKLNLTFILSTPVSPTGIMCFAFGENGFYSDDFFNWTQLDLGGIQGEVTAAHANSTDLFLGFTTAEKSGKGNGGIYRKPLDQILVGIENNSDISAGALLEQNYPNPFGESTKITYSLTNSGFVSLKVYDVFGKEIQTLANGFQTIGTYTIPFDASHLDGGIYFYSLKVGNNAIETKRMILVR